MNLVFKVYFLHKKVIIMVDGILIKELRKEKGLSQEELGYMIGTEGNLVSRWERGASSPSPYYLHKLSEVFDKPVEYP